MPEFSGLSCYNGKIYVIKLYGYLCFCARIIIIQSKVDLKSFMVMRMYDRPLKLSLSVIKKPTYLTCHARRYIRLTLLQ